METPDGSLPRERGSPDRGTRFWTIAERGLSIQNPIGPCHIRRCSRFAGLKPGDRVLDLGCGKGGPAMLLARDSGCHVVGLDRSADFIRRARRRFERNGLAEQGLFLHQDGREPFEHSRQFRMGMCLGATFVLGGLERTVRWLVERTLVAGFVLIGECFLQSNTPADILEASGEVPNAFVDLASTVQRIEAQGVRLLAIHGATREDWDRYASTIWSNIERYVGTHPDAEDSPYFLDRMRRMQSDYLQWERDYLGWALFLGQLM